MRLNYENSMPLSIIFELILDMGDLPPIKQMIKSKFRLHLFSFIDLFLVILLGVVNYISLFYPIQDLQNSYQQLMSSNISYLEFFLIKNNFSS